MRAILVLTLAALVLAAAPATAASRIVSPEALSSDDLPRFEVLDQDAQGVRLAFALPALAVETLPIDDQTFTAAAIPGGGLEGETGAPALPVFTRLLAIPADVGVEVQVQAEEVTVLPGVRLLPQQADEEGAAFAYDPAAYARDGFGATAGAEAGEPAVCGPLRLVPLTVRPVRYNPARQELEVAGRMTVTVRFAGNDPVNARPVRPEFIPRSFDRLFRELVVNYAGPQAGQRAGNGSYLLICPNNADVISRLQPLVEWHTRKGIPVRLATTAETGTTNSQIKSFIQGIYASADPPLEYICLVGDGGGSISLPTFNETLSGYGGEGDHPYTLLAGDDVLADAHVGRLSVSSTTEVETVVAKTLRYEGTPNLSDTGWFSRACLVGDEENPSGFSTVQTMQWIKTRLRQIGYTQIDTLFGGPTVSQISTALNRGDTLYGYRGYYGFSGWNNSHTLSLTNVDKLHFACFSTCGTGSWANGYANSEAFLRAGNASAPRAGIGAIGTATTGTHTRFNNCYTLGVFHGLIYEDQWEQGAAHTRGKLNLYLNYYNSGQSNYVTIFSYWNSLMGDPAVRIWSAFPGTFSVAHAASVPVGSNAYAVTVTSSGQPVAGADVCVWKGTETYAVGTTDAQGQLELPVALAAAGTMKLTVTKHNYLPFQADVAVSAPTLYVGLQSIVVDDDGSGESSGNGNGLASPPETIELRVQVKNFGTQSASGVTGTLTSDDPYVTITDASETFGTIGGGGTAWSADDFGFSVAAGCPHGHVARFGLNLVSGASQWHSLIEVPIASAELRVTAVTWYNAGNGQLDPGESLELSLLVRNEGTVAANGATGVLSTTSPWLNVVDANGSFGNVAPSGTAENTTDRFRLSADAGTYQGHLATLRLVTTFNGGARDTSYTTVTVGTRSSDDPIGPDRYGYFAFDNTDTGYPEAPVYSWVEIDPNQGGSGTQVTLGDYSDYQDKSRAVDLPFTFQFYGESFTRATICSNGWIAMGDTYLTDYRNWSIPSAGAPQNLIAVFWDDLEEVNSPAGHVYSWHDAANHRWVVQWSRMRNAVGDAAETSQAIFYDPAHYATPSGDGIIVLQYHTVNNVDGTDGYCTVGIQNAMQDDGLLYSYFNVLSPGAASLAAGRAIKFVPATAQPQGVLAGTVRNSSTGQTPLAGASVHLLGTDRTYSSGADGSYAGSAPGGIYDVTCSRAGFEPDTAFGVVIVPPQTTVVDFSLLDVGGPQISGVTRLLSTTDPIGPYAIDATVSDPSGLGPVTLHYRANGAGWVALPMTLAGGAYHAAIPGLPTGTRADYYVEAEDALGHVSVEPAGAPAEFYTFYITQVSYATEAEDPGPDGWQLGVAGDGASSGLWIRDDPVGTVYNGLEMQPEDDHTAPPGTKCFVTGNGSAGGAAGDADVDGGCTTLQSPVFDLSLAEAALVRYWRWYGEGGNSTDDDWVAYVSSDGGSNWVELEREAEHSGGWEAVAVDLTEKITLTGSVVFRFQACDENTAGLVEAAIDDFSLEVYIPNPDAVPGLDRPAVFALERGRPNPFAGATAVRFALARAGTARLVLYDVQGRAVRTLWNGPAAAGPHELVWDGRNDRGAPLPSGVYFARLQADGRHAEAKLLKLE